LFALEGGALLIDTPGMRELQPWADESAVEGVFEDVSLLAQGCRFADCSHTQEPGCAVLAAIAGGTLEAARLEHYQHLRREAAFEERKRDKAAAAEQKRRWKIITQQARTKYRERERDGR
jgi:ribosome biogenesis GTPase